MATNTPNLKLIKAEQEDYIDETLVDSFGINWDILDTEIAKKILNAGGIPSIQAGLDASKPNPGTAGRVYVATDTQIIYRDSGAAWVKVGVVKWDDIDGKPSDFPPAAHKESHQPGGNDALPTAAPSGGLGTSNGAGTSTSFARADHVHKAFDSVAPANVGSTASPGSSTIAARRDHVHALEDGVVTDAKIGDRTIDDADHPTGNTGKLTTLLGWIAHMIKSITGKSDWRTAPVITLETLAAHKGRHATGGADALTPADIGAETPAGAQAKAEAAAGAVQAELDAHLSDYAQHGVTMGHENDLYVAKIRPLIEFTPLEANYGGAIYAIAADDEFIYVGGETTRTVRKLRKSDLSQVAESATYGGTIRAIAADDEFVYVGGETTRTVRKLRKSDLSQVAESADYGGGIYAIAPDDEFVYVGGGTPRTAVRVIENLDLIKIIRRYQ